MLSKANLVCCNLCSLTPQLSFKNRTVRASLKPNITQLRVSPHRLATASAPFSCFRQALDVKTKSPLVSFQGRGRHQICHSSLNQQDLERESEVRGNGNNGGGQDGRDWTTSILLFLLWAGLICYVYFLAPNQTPTRDVYFLQKLLNLKGDDGFRMNEVLVSLWYIMGLWPVAYSMLLIPTGRSSKSKIPVWPFLMLSCFGGAYALLPYFVLWKPPAPPIEETQLKKWPLIFLESKVTAAILLAAGAALVIYACLAGDGIWREFYQYFRESKFIHIMSIDFAILSTFAPFWVYNDITARKWFDKGFWFLPISLIPLLGPSLYLLLRPSLSTMAISQTPTEPE